MRGPAAGLHVGTGQLACIVQGSLVGLLRRPNLVGAAESQTIGTVELAELGCESAETLLHLQRRERIRVAWARQGGEQPRQPCPHVPMVGRFGAKRQTLDAKG